ncbi:hypothetical protein V1279_002905 [Bradyrhizobium sp. AZCC 1610]
MHLGGYAKARPEKSQVLLVSPDGGVTEPPATVEPSGYPCLVESLFLRSRLEGQRARGRGLAAFSPRM